MKKEEYEELIKIGINNGADFVEIYDENTYSKNYIFNDSKLDSINSNNIKGIGIRIIKNNNVYYSSTNNKKFENVKNLIDKLTSSFSTNKEQIKSFKLDNMIEKKQKVKMSHDSISVEEKKKILSNLDKIIRNYSELIQQVTLSFIENDKSFIIANSNGKYIKYNKIITRFLTNIYVEKKGNKENEFTDYATGTGYEFLENVDLNKKVLDCCKSAIKKLDAVNIKGGEMPVIIAKGFGAVIFHEACGHGLEATSITPKISVFKDDLGKKIATDKVTLIDDGTIEYGVYCERMSGGSVNPATGEFNFAVETASLIEKGKVTKKIKGITLIGTSKEVLKNVEMISDDLELAGGYCGSESGMIPVTIGQPTIKISKILVGGME